MTHTNPVGPEDPDIVTRLRNEVSSEANTDDRTPDIPIGVPARLTSLLAEHGMFSLEVDIVLDALLAEAEPLSDDIYLRFHEATRSELSARPKALIIEQILTEERARRGQQLTGFTTSNDELDQLEQIENGRKPIDSLVADRLADWILWLDIEPAIAMPAVERSLIASGSGYAGTQSLSGSLQEKFIEEVRLALLEKRQEKSQSSVDQSKRQ